MCGIPCANPDENKLIVKPENTINMPPSVTVGAEPPKMPNPAESGQDQGMQQQASVPLNREMSDVDESAAMQKAIALSLQELKELPSSSYYTDEREVDLSPFDSKRKDLTPVGLKNIGNSCWFNVVVQPLFHIPAFRDFLFNYSTDVNYGNYVKSTKSTEKDLVQVLRHLCANLLASEKKFIDPTDCVTLFQNDDMIKNTQQDVCEFIHKLLEKLEEEFKMMRKYKGVEKENAECKLSNDAEFINPILQLFYGESKKEDYNGPKQEPFGQYPLFVQSYKNIHESILASMTEQNVQNPEVIRPVNQLSWFKRLPPVLIFSLSRYEYSKEKRRAEKVHNKFDFSDCLYLDRYMETNKQIIKNKHKKVAEIKNELKSLYMTLDQYQKFGSGEGKYPIIDILKYTLEFAQNREQDEKSFHSVMEVDCASSTDCEMIESVDKSYCMEVETKSRDFDMCGQFSMESHSSFNFTGFPTPETIMEGEIAMLSSCLPRWQAEMEHKVLLLEKAISDLEHQLNVIYDEPSLQCTPYKLHAVIVHEGQAYGGHYWVYIYHKKKNIWLKFNDIQVIESCWEDLLQDSVGGQNNASAYCLMYIDKTRYDELFASDSQDGESIMSILPIDLQEYVKTENIQFLKELHDYEFKKCQDANRDKENKAVSATSPNSPETTMLDEDEAKFYLSIKNMMSDYLAQQLSKFDSCYNIEGWIEKTVSQGKLRINELASKKRESDRFGEPAILDFSIYLQQNLTQLDSFVLLYAEEILWQLVPISDSQLVSSLENPIKMCLKKLIEKHIGQSGPEYFAWKNNYHMYIKCAWYFNCGYKRFHSREYNAALAYFLHCLNFHRQLDRSFPSGPHKTLDIKLIFKLHRVCFLLVNDVFINEFMKANTEAEILEIDNNITKFILPALYFSSNSPFEEDISVTERVRGKWCELLDKLTEFKSKMFQPIITKLILSTEQETRDSDGVSHYEGEAVNLPLLTVPPFPNVLSIYEEYKQISISVMSGQDKSESQISDL